LNSTRGQFLRWDNQLNEETDPKLEETRYLFLGAMHKTFLSTFLMAMKGALCHTLYRLMTLSWFILMAQKP
jgi:hypothetical protein